MNNLVKVGLVAFAFIALACSGTSAPDEIVGGFPVGDMSDEDALRAMDELGRQLSDEGDHAGLLELMEPAIRDACPIERFARLSRLGEDLDGILRSHERDGEIVRIDVDGDRAVITYLDYSPARDELEEDTDEAVKIDGRWFAAGDDEDLEACGAAFLAEDYYTHAASAAMVFGVQAGGINSGRLDPSDFHADYFTTRFQEDCPLGRYQESWPSAIERYRDAFVEPFEWDVSGSSDYVAISWEGNSVGSFSLEGTEWRMDVFAGLIAC